VKIFVMGAGGQGGPCASILAHDVECSKIVLADIDAKMLEKVEAKLNSSKLSTAKVDANSIDQVTTAAEGCDVIIDLAPPWVALNVMKAALEVNAGYVNTAFDSPFWEQLVEGKPLELDQEFKSDGLTALLGCGMTPGFLNVMARYYADKLDTVESIKLRLGKKRVDYGPYDDLIKPWHPGWSPKQALIDCAVPPHKYRNGSHEEMEPYGEIEEWDFPEPVGKMAVSHHSHEEVYTLPFFIGKEIKYCDFKYYVAPQPAALVTLGLASQEPINVNGVDIKPIDFVAELMPKPLSAFLEETEESALKNEQNAFMSMMIEMTGSKNGQAITYKINCPRFTSPAKELLNLFGTTLVNVSLPAVIGAKMIFEKRQSGVIFPEQLDPEDFLNRFSKTGIPYQWEEL